MRKTGPRLRPLRAPGRSPPGSARLRPAPPGFRKSRTAFARRTNLSAFRTVFRSASAAPPFVQRHETARSVPPNHSLLPRPERRTEARGASNRISASLRHARNENAEPADAPVVRPDTPPAPQQRLARAIKRPRKIEVRPFEKPCGTGRTFRAPDRWFRVIRRPAAFEVLRSRAKPHADRHPQQKSMRLSDCRPPPGDDGSLLPSSPGGTAHPAEKERSPPGRPQRTVRKQTVHHVGRTHFAEIRCKQSSGGIGRTGNERNERPARRRGCAPQRTEKTAPRRAAPRNRREQVRNPCGGGLTLPPERLRKPTRTRARPPDRASHTRPPIVRKPRPAATAPSPRIRGTLLRRSGDRHSFCGRGGAKGAQTNPRNDG